MLPRTDLRAKALNNPWGFQIGLTMVIGRPQIEGISDNSLQKVNSKSHAKDAQASFLSQKPQISPLGHSLPCHGAGALQSFPPPLLLHSVPVNVELAIENPPRGRHLTPSADVFVYKLARSTSYFSFVFFLLIFRAQYLLHMVSDACK